MCKIVQVFQGGSYVHLLEYNNIQGMVTVTEFSRKIIYNVRKIMNVGKVFPAEVLAVDPVQNYIDLSKKNLNAEDRKQCEDWYEKSTCVHTAVQRLARSLYPEEDNISNAMLKVYEEHVWPMYDMTHRKHAYETLANIAKGTVKAPHEAFVEVCRHYFKQSSVTLCAKVALISLSPQGIDDIKMILCKARDKHTNLEVQYISNKHTTLNLYALLLCSYDTNKDVKILNEIADDVVNDCLQLAVHHQYEHVFRMNEDFDLRPSVKEYATVVQSKKEDNEDNEEDEDAESDLEDE